MTDAKINADDLATTRSQTGVSERPLTPAAKRALKEAEERRRAAQDQKQDKPTEVGGRKGPEPTRYGDWEKKGIVSDF